MAWYSYDSFDPISISAVPAGWRALYSSSTTKKGFEVVPLVGWAVFRVSVRGSLSGAEEVLQSGNVIEGAVVSPGNGPVVCASDELCSIRAFALVSAAVGTIRGR